LSDQLSQPPPPSTPPLSPAAGGPPTPDQLAHTEALPRASWGPGRAFAGFAFVLAVSLVFSGIVVAIDNDVESLGALIAVQATLAGSLLLGAFLFASPGLRSLAPREALGLKRPVRKAIWLSVVTYFGYLACALVIALLITPEQEDIARDLGSDEGVLGTLIAGFLIVIVAPVTEEIFFRGFFFQGLRRGMAVVLAALISSGIWALLHYTGPETWGVVLQLTVFGLWLSWLYSKTGSIYPAIAVHMVNNAVAFTILVSS
jgi:membrane protease YdiL (CAAX protease family)